MSVTFPCKGAVANLPFVRHSDSQAVNSRAHPTAQEKRRRERGFSLIELMVVVVIIGILALMIVPRVIDRPDQARMARARQDIQVLENALQLYRLDNRVYPTTTQGLKALIAKPVIDPVPPNWSDNGYLARLPKDPWGRNYLYLVPGVHGEIDVFSYGADGEAGGIGNDADIVNWTAE